MNRKFLLATTVLFVLSNLFGFLVHGVLLADDYRQFPHLYRSDAESMNYFHFMLLAHLSIAGAMAWIYAQGRTDRPWPGQGIRFGLAVALLMTIPVYLIYYVVMPLPAALVVQQILFDTPAMVVMGVAVAWVYRAPAPAAG